jgi:hypothetical protein
MKFLLLLSFTVLLLLGQKAANAQNCTLSCPSNIVIKADSSHEGAIVSFPVATALGDCGVITYTPASGSFFRLGSHSVIATNATGQKCYFTVTVTDNEPPLLSQIRLSSKRIWPVTNKMKKMGVYYTASDNGEEVSSVLSVSSNDQESVNRDWEIINNHLIRLKASRLSNGEARIYTITVTSTDRAGNITRRTTSIAVSKTMTNGNIVKN